MSKMRIQKIHINGFRKLENIELKLDEETTLVVGKNNSGKTSVSTLFGQFLESKKFRYEDFSFSYHEKWNEALDLWKELQNAKGPEGQEIQEKLKASIPTIVLKLYVKYDKNDSLASLNPFIMDLDDERQDAGIMFEFAPKDTKNFFNSYEDGELREFLKDNVPDLYHFKVSAFDCLDETNTQVLDKEAKSKVSDLLLVNHIFAQRDLGEDSQKESQKLSANFGKFYDAYRQSEKQESELKAFLKEIEVQWKDIYDKLFDSFHTDLETFGIPGQNSQRLGVKANFDIKKVLAGSTSAHFLHDNDVELPESYEGLGYRNMILIILRLISFAMENVSKEPRPGLHLIFIEEPEAHLHPQMQSTFIKKINDFLRKKSLNAQIIITTHSSHIVSDSDLSSIRYFDISKSPYVKVRDIREFKLQQNKDPKGKESLKFLKQYMTLQKCDLFFADKAVLLEGTVERLLLPEFIRKFDEKHNTNLKAHYITTVEVGGAYAHKFEPLLEFIGIPTLVITDLDSIKGRSKCRVSEGVSTSNPALKSWIPGIKGIPELISCKESKKIKGRIRVAYQVAEAKGVETARSFEEAFMLAQSQFEASDYPAISDTSNSDPYSLAEKISSKTDFAMDILLKDEWQIPKYIEDGLLWLESM